MENQQIITITFFRFVGFSNAFWAFKQMGLAPFSFKKVKGTSFLKLFGSGAGNGFSIKMNPNVYGLLSVWKEENDANIFFESHPLFQSYKKNSAEQYTVFMKTTMAHGVWDGKTPFEITEKYNENALVAVITRATIKKRYIPYFWKFVPKVSKSIEDKAGRIFSIGIGELPIVQQATFSLWETGSLMKAYAYKSAFHQEVIQKTRDLGWYREELFARFSPYKSEGTWGGKKILDV
jgi:hypothetical protein